MVNGELRFRGWSPSRRPHLKGVCYGVGSGRSLILIRHPGLDPGSTAAAKSWTPDQVRGDAERVGGDEDSV